MSAPLSVGGTFIEISCALSRARRLVGLATLVSAADLHRAADELAEVRRLADDLAIELRDRAKKRRGRP